VTSTLETERLVLRPWTADDVGLLLRLSKEPRVTRYIAAGDIWPAQKALEVSDRVVGHWHDRHYGWYVAVSKVTGQELGFTALDVARPETEGLTPGEHEIGWWLDPDHWGHGYTTEAAKAVRDHAFNTLSVPHLAARIHPENTGSVAVATKLGMALQEELTTAAGYQMAVYRLER